MKVILFTKGCMKGSLPTKHNTNDKDDDDKTDECNIKGEQFIRAAMDSLVEIADDDFNVVIVKDSSKDTSHFKNKGTPAIPLINVEYGKGKFADYWVHLLEAELPISPISERGSPSSTSSSSSSSSDCWYPENKILGRLKTRDLEDRSRFRSSSNNGVVIKEMSPGPGILHDHSIVAERVYCVHVKTGRRVVDFPPMSVEQLVPWDCGASPVEEASASSPSSSSIHWPQSPIFSRNPWRR